MMKVNPVAIQSYQQIVHKEPRQQNPVDTQTKKRGDVAVISGDQITIRPTAPLSGSQVTVRATNGSYADLLSPPEKQALDLLFTKFRDSQRFGSSYLANNDQAAGKNKNLGQLVDVKV